MEPTRNDLIMAYEYALRAVDPREAVSRSLSIDGDVLSVGSRTLRGVSQEDIVVVAIGKAATGMAIGAHEALGASRGLVVTSHEGDSPYQILIGSHPIPDEKSLMCGESLLEFVSTTRPSDVVIFLISGGGSALAVAPVAGVTIRELSEMNEVLIASGMPIEKINAVRASVSRIKGGGLARKTIAERRLTLTISDVIGADQTHVASGPSTGLDGGESALDVIETYELLDDLPHSVLSAIERESGSGLMAGEGDLPGSGGWPVEVYDVIGSAEIAARAAATSLASAGFDATVITTEMSGEAREEAVSMIEGAEPKVVSISAGETTVTLTGDGVGGRNQEAALAGAIHIDGSDVIFAALGTDGIDGPTRAAGAIVDGSTASRGRDLGVDLYGALKRNDSHTVLEALGETVITGPSGTNVADLWMVYRGSETAEGH